MVRRSVTLDERQENADWSSVGFFETEINREVHRYGPLAHVWSTYEYRLRQDGPVIGRGINSFQLFHDEGRWWIRSLAFFGESAEEPLPVVPAEYQTSVAELEGIWSIIGKPGQGEEYTGNVVTRALERDVLAVRWEVGPDVFEGKGQLAGEGRILGRFTGAFDGFFELQVQDKGEMAAWWWSEDSQQWARESWERR